MSNEPNGAAAPPTTSHALTPYQERSLAMREEISQDATPRAIVPRTLAEAKAFAEMIASSTLVPEQLKNRAADVAMMILAGAELGFPPVKSLTLFHVMEGVPKLSADGIAGIVTASPLCEYLEPIEQSDTRVTWRGKKKGRPEVTLSWTDDDVRRANLDRPTRSGAPSNHVKFPRAMKNARCKAELAKLLWPELVSGIVTAEEARDIAHARDLEGPTSPAGMSAPPPPPASSPPPKAASTPKATGSKAAAKNTPIDTTATERPASPASSPTSSASSAPTSSAPSSAASSSGGLPPDPARDEAFSKAREAAEVLENARRENGGSLYPPPADPVPPSNGNDTRPDATTDAVSPDAASDASDGFGDDEPAAPPAKSIEAFEAALRAAVSSKNVDALKAAKNDYLPWSKIEGPDGGKQHAHRMRDAYAKAAAELGVK